MYRNKQKLIKAKQVAKILIRFCKIKNNKIYTMIVGLHASMQSIAHGQSGNWIINHTNGKILYIICLTFMLTTLLVKWRTYKCQNVFMKIDKLNNLYKQISFDLCTLHRWNRDRFMHACWFPYTLYHLFYISWKLIIKTVYIFMHVGTYLDTAQAHMHIHIQDRAGDFAS